MARGDEDARGDRREDLLVMDVDQVGDLRRENLSMCYASVISGTQTEKWLKMDLWIKIERIVPWISWPHFWGSNVLEFDSTEFRLYTESSDFGKVPKPSRSEVQSASFLSFREISNYWITLTIFFLSDQDVAYNLYAAYTKWLNNEDLGPTVWILVRGSLFWRIFLIGHSHK